MRKSTYQPPLGIYNSDFGWEGQSNQKISYYIYFQYIYIFNIYIYFKSQVFFQLSAIGFAFPVTGNGSLVCHSWPLSGCEDSLPEMSLNLSFSKMKSKISIPRLFLSHDLADGLSLTNFSPPLCLSMLRDKV